MSNYLSFLAGDIQFASFFPNIFLQVYSLSGAWLQSPSRFLPFNLKRKT